MQDAPDYDVSTPDGRTRGDAIVVAVDPHEQPDTDEITSLAAAAGYEVVEAHAQRRPEDGGYHVGRGKAEELARRLTTTGAEAVVFDDPLTPGQYRTLAGLFPAGTRIVDRHRLVLDIFADRAGDRAARLQVELARLRYELPRVRATEERTHMQRAAETGSRVVDLERRIRTVERKLAEATETAAERRQQRREQGFDLVALAGYTNAGKSTLLHRLADDLAIDDHEPDHADLDGVATVADRLFVTLETTTRRATLGGRPVLVTDTVGLVDGVPHDLVASFSTTLATVADADVAILIADASDPTAELRAKLRVCLDELDAPRGELVVVLNKVDLVDEAALAERRDAVTALLPDDAALVAVSATEGTGVDRLRDRVVDGLPTASATFDMPNDGETQAFLAWAHDRGEVTAEYAGERVSVTVEARPAVVTEATSRVADRDGAVIDGTDGGHRV